MTRRQKRNLYRIIASALLLVAVFLLVQLLEIKHIPLVIAIFTIPYLAVGFDVLKSAFLKIISGQLFDEQFLMAAATLGAFAIGEYAEAVAVMLFYQIGELFQGIAVGKSRKSIAALMDIRPDIASVIRNGAEISVPPEEVEIGEAVIVRPGEKIPLDGIVTKGESNVNSSALTGESLPLYVTKGDSVKGGCVNIDGVIEMRAEGKFADSTVCKILELAENSSEKKAKVENFITRFSHYYTPCVVIAALLLALIPSIITHEVAKWTQRALVFLVVSCPCALVVSVPLSFFGGIGGASREGILIKGAGFMEALANTDIFVFDKTGTLTSGKFSVADIYAVDKDTEKLLELAACIEFNSNHPIARAIVNAYSGEINQLRISSANELGGLGISVEIDGKEYYAGNERLMRKVGTPCEEINQYGSCVHIAAADKYLGYIIVTDTVKDGARDSISVLRGLGVKRCVMLTGDLKKSAEAVASKIGISEYKYELLPQDKVRITEELLSDGRVAFVGDGINDSPVLARADVGIAMGGIGSDAAIEAADIVIMDDKISKLARAVEISRRTLRIVRQNIIISLAVKFSILALSVFGLANMWIAVFGDVGVMIIAVLNAMRTLKYRKNEDEK